MTSLQWRNLLWALLAWASTICNMTLVVGTSAVVMLHVGGTAASVPLGCFFGGSSLVSWLVTPWLFDRWGRKMGFLVGVGFGLVATALGAGGIAIGSPELHSLSQGVFGAYAGIGFFLRFAAVEVVPPHWAARAITLVVSGGCLAAFVGPESAQASRDWISDHLFMGIFIMTGIYSVLNGVFILLIQFPPPKEGTKDPAPSEGDVEGEEPPSENSDEVTVRSVIPTRAFLVPMSTSLTAWIVMGMTMSMVRVIMQAVGYSSRQSLLVIELHFLGMYGPGFFTGRLITKYGPEAVSYASVVVFGVAICFMWLAKSEEDGSIAIWILGLMIVGVAWNCGFTGGTVWLTRLYAKTPHLRSGVQAANDALMFGLAGGWITASSYIVDAGGGELDGWRVLNAVALGIAIVQGLVLAWDWTITRGNENIDAK